MLHHDRRGQTMIEAIIALGIIVTSVASALTLVSTSINAEKESEALITAGNLAREGIEVVRMLRDSNWLAGADFDAGFSGTGNDHLGIAVFSPDTATWSLDFSPLDMEDVTTRVFRTTTSSGSSIEGLMRQATSQPSGTAPTSYRRTLVLDPICDSGAGYTFAASGSDCGAFPKVGIRVQSNVRWSVGPRQRTISFEEQLMDWR
jgi:type II secretory pathway pseudopilin PulG